jgi:hypothetical protein
MRRFLVFSGDKYYPSGGWGDYRDSADTLDEAIQLANGRFNLSPGQRCDWAHIVDTTIMEVVSVGRHQDKWVITEGY